MSAIYKCFIAAIALLQFTPSTAQEITKKNFCGHAKINASSRTTVASPAEDDYDVKYVKLNLAVSNVNTHVSGDVTTRAKVTASVLSSYVFELNPVLTIDSVVVNGTTYSASGSGAVRTVSLSTPIPHDSMFTARVFYNGTPASGTSMSINGINTLGSATWGNRVTFTLSESYKADEWWPCKQSLRDKIDSADIWLTVPDTLKAGSNGVLAAVTTIDTDHVRYEWKERYPIDYYLISLSVSDYIDYSYYMHFTGSSDSMLIQNYIYDNSATLPYFRGQLDTTGLMVDYFSQLYGRYRFWKEKYGHCMAPLSGGMEHQTMTTAGYFPTWLIAHELGHQWFGDNVTCGTWADIFVNEGFASYSEYLFYDHFKNHTVATNDMISRQQNVKTMPDGAIFVDDTTNEARIFDERLSYDKGAVVIHMLRFVLNDDSAFFRVLRTYQAQQKDSTATIEDVKSVVTSIAGPVVNSMRIDTFFSQWIYREGFPIYDVTWNQKSSDVYVQLDQATSMPASVPFFFTPMEIKLHSGSGDTVIRVFNSQPSQLFHFTWDKPILSLKLDPSYWVLYQLNSNRFDATLSLAAAQRSTASISPNPATDYWQLRNLQPGDGSLLLTDINGKVILTQSITNTTEKINAASLPAGIYVLKVMSNTATQTFKLVKE